MNVVVTKISCEPLSVPLVDPFVIASGRVDATRSVLVTAELREGDRAATGLGEASCLWPVTEEDQPDALAAVEKAAPVLAGRTFDGFEALHVLLDEALMTRPVARSGVEMAIVDAVARLRGVPVFTLLSGRTTAAPIETDITLPILPPARMAELAAHWWAKGFRFFKVKVGKVLQDDLAALRAIAVATPAAKVRVDANCGYTPDAAITFLEEARALGLHVECLEQPCGRDDLDGMAQVSRRTSVPVLADESAKTLAEFERVRERGAARGVNLKVAKSGGLLRAYEIGVAAQRAGMLLMVGGMVETRLGMTAATHLAAALGGVAFADLDTAWLLATDPFEGGYSEAGPVYTLSNAPGLDVRIR